MSARDAALLHLERFLEKAHPGFATDRRLVAEAQALSSAYTTGGVVAPDAAASLAYLAHFGPRAIVAVAHALDGVRVPKTCVDVGAGSGASALVLLYAGAKRVTLVEPSARAGDLAKRLLTGPELHGEVNVVKGALENTLDRHAELCLSAFTFGELALEPREGFAALEKLAPKATLHVLVDAGDRPRARRLQTLRDALVAEGRGILAPCPHTDPCPALVRERDWCHTRVDKHLPDLLAAFARAVGRDDERMALSFLTVDTQAGAPRTPGILVIGDPLVEKGRTRLPVCGPAGLRFVQILKRHREAHDRLRDVERGARLSVDLVTGASIGKDGTASVERFE